MASVGDVFLGELFLEDGITPKAGCTSKTKMLVILGEDDAGNLVCGVVINSKINQRNEESQYPIKCEVYSFLHHNSFVNCDNLITLEQSRLSSFGCIGCLNADDLELVRKTVVASRVIKGKLKKKFNLFSSENRSVP